VTSGGGDVARVAYLTKRFPRLSETFILDEILSLERAGVPLQVFAVADPVEQLSQPDVAQVRSSVIYLRQSGRWRLVRGFVTSVLAHFRLVATDPARWRQALSAARQERAITGTIRPFIDAGRLAVQLRRTGCTHVHAAFAHGPASTARFAYLLTGIPYSFGAHAKDLYLSDRRELADKVADASFVLTCSMAAQQELVSQTGADAKIVLAYHGVDTERFAPGPAGAVADAPKRILAVGRLVEKKGYPVLLAAVRQLLDEGHEVRLRVVGGGPDQERLATLARELGLDRRVSFAGARTHQQIVAEYAQADLFVQASVVIADGDRDGVPNSLLEAMASGLPVVASRVSGIPEAIEDGVSGVLVPPGDPGALAQALARVVTEDGFADRLGVGARHRAIADFDRRTCAQALAPLFRPVAAEPAR